MAIALTDEQIEGLTVQERLDLIGRIWDSMPTQIAPGELPDWHLKLIAERRAEAEANPGVGRPWREVMDDLRKR